MTNAQREAARWLAARHADIDEKLFGSEWNNRFENWESRYLALVGNESGGEGGGRPDDMSPDAWGSCRIELPTPPAEVAALPDRARIIEAIQLTRLDDEPVVNGYATLVSDRISEGDIERVADEVLAALAQRREPNYGAAMNAAHDRWGVEYNDGNRADLRAIVDAALRAADGAKCERCGGVGTVRVMEEGEHVATSRCPSCAPPTAARPGMAAAPDGAKCESAAEASRIVVAEGGWDARLGKVDVGHHWLARSTALDQRWVRVELIPVIPDPKDATIAAMRTQPTAARPVGWTRESLIAAIQRQVVECLPDPLPGGKTIAEACADIALSRAGSPFDVEDVRLVRDSGPWVRTQLDGYTFGVTHRKGFVARIEACEALTRIANGIAACEGEVE